MVGQGQPWATQADSQLSPCDINKGLRLKFSLIHLPFYEKILDFGVVKPF